MIQSCSELMDYINEIGFLPLLNMGISGWSADESVDDDYGYIVLPDGSWEWALWQWKGEIIRETGCAYGKFFERKAAFISRQWWNDFCNYRRNLTPYPAEDSIEYMILQTLREGGSMITRDLRRACGFTGTKMRSRFDSYISKLQANGYIVTEDFVYPHDKHGKQYGWGWSLLTTPESLFGKEACQPQRSPAESHDRIFAQMKRILPSVSDKQIERIISKI